MRTGVVTKKLGMSLFFDKKGASIPVTLLQLDDCQVVGQRNKEKDGVVAVRVGYGKVKANKVTKPLKGYFSRHKVDFKRNIADFRVAEDATLAVGTHINADHYVVGQFVDVTGISTGKGFAGVMKRHGFKGLRASHGVSISHRSHGSTGQRQDPGKVFKGKKMAGHMGCDRVTISNLEILEIDIENNVLVVRGAVPGTQHSRILVKDAKKKGLPIDVPYPGVSAAKVEVIEEITEEVKEVSAEVAPTVEAEVVVEKPIEESPKTDESTKEMTPPGDLSSLDPRIREDRQPEKE
jgi:large subunit ribosomal protein L3